MGVSSSNNFPPSKKTWSIEPPPLRAPPNFLSSSDSNYCDSQSENVDQPQSSWVVRSPKVPNESNFTTKNHSTMNSTIHKERLEWSRTISNLAAANQQLTSAYTLTLKHLEQLYTEVSLRKSFDTTKKTDQGSAKKNIVIFRSNLDKKSSRKARFVSPMKVTKKPIRKSFSKHEKLKEPSNLEVVNLKKEIEELKASRSESQIRNAKLMEDLEAQKMIVCKLMERNEICKKEFEVNLSERVEKLGEMSEKLNTSEMENSRLLEKIDTFQIEKATADERISVLEQELRNLTALETEKAEESQKTSSEILENTALVDEDFKKDLSLKREARQRAIAAVSFEMDRLRQELDAEKVAHSETCKVLELLKAAQTETLKPKETEQNSITNKQVEAVRLNDLLKISSDFTNEIRYQLEKMDDLKYRLENRPETHVYHVSALQKLAEETKQHLKNREVQMNALRDRLSHVLANFSDIRFLMEKSDDVAIAIKCNKSNLVELRKLEEGKNRVLVKLMENALKESNETKKEVENVRESFNGVEEELRIAEEKIEKGKSEIASLESQLGLTKADCRDLQNQMSVVNNLFTQMLLNASSSELDLDRLTELLQENHDLISDMAKANNSEAAALPKLLLELIEQVDGRSNKGQNQKKEEEDLQEENIAHNLPKVWRVLMELLSCHSVATNCTASEISSSAPDSCYKSVDTPTGPRLVISVSKTYIRLKDLILEKKNLEKEMNRMKQLNSHLETKLGEQEKRLSFVSDELSKTWNVVGRMQAQHQQLHTHEQILRYELQQKRKMLQELKQELEYCREKWESARQKNNSTEIEWQSLRREFAARKAHSCQIDAFNSGESGFSDERDEETDEDDVKNEIGKKSRLGSRRKSRKATNELTSLEKDSENSTEIYAHDETRNSKAEKSKQVQNSSVKSEKSLSNKTIPPDSEEIKDPIDMALTNVIEDIIKVNEDYTYPNLSPNSRTCNLPKSEIPEPDSKNSNPQLSIFSIGPVMNSAVPENAVNQVTSSFFGRFPENVEDTGKNKENDEKPSQVPSIEENLDPRAARLKRLEEQADWLVKKMSATNRRGSVLSNRLEELHEIYGSVPEPPVMPDVLPNLRIPTTDCSSENV